MCDYCNKKVRNKKIKDVDNDIEDKISIVFLREPMLDVTLDAIDSDGYKANDYFPINYCPMCGRDLRRSNTDEH